MSRSLRALLILGLAAFVGLLSYGVAAQAPDTTIDDALARGNPGEAPAFDLPVLTVGDAPYPLQRVVGSAAADGRISLRELRGAPVVINFWASWCEPCRVEAPVLEREWRRSATRGVVVLGVDQQDATGDARDFLRRHGTSYPNVREAGRETSRAYGTTGLPETFFISAAGKIVGHVYGAVNAGQLRSGVQAARQGEPVAPQRGAGSQ